jgi:hypothetical protein
VPKLPESALSLPLPRLPDRANRTTTSTAADKLTAQSIVSRITVLVSPETAQPSNKVLANKANIEFLLRGRFVSGLAMTQCCRVLTHRW